MIEDLEIDGIPASFVRRPGPITAGLVFRVGQADETLTSRGITHLLEHLALFPLGLTDLHSNGQTAGLLTHFHVHGTSSDVTSFFGALGASFADLPFDRLDREKSIVKTEAAGRGRGVANDLLIWRHGARTDGLSSYPEWGIDGLTPNEVASWAASRFTRENAGLWIVGEEVPPGLSIALPAGHRIEPPVMSAMIDDLPAYFSEGHDKVALDMLVDRSTAARIMADVLDRELYQALRQREGLSYTAAARYEARDANRASVVAFADSLPDRVDAVLGELVDVVAALRVGRIDPAVVASMKDRARAQLDHPDADSMRVVGRVTDRLMGGTQATLDELRAKLEDVDVEAVHAAVLEGLDTALIQVPHGRDLAWAGYTPAPVYSVSTVEGAGHPRVDAPEVSLVIGQDGVSTIEPDGARTVRIEECEAVLRYPDGGRLLIGGDGIVIPVEPTLYAIEPHVLAALDARLPPELVVTMPARSPDHIPVPDVVEAEAPPSTWRRRARGGRRRRDDR